jgi:uncharacterized membrane protein YeaQ/YmgE (transglycosylase-associated protein family)
MAFGHLPGVPRKAAVITLAGVTLSAGTIVAWLAIGLVAGWLTSRVMKGGGLVGYLIVGMIGAGICGFLFRIAVSEEAGFWGSFPVAALGAHLLLTLFRFLGFKRRDT